MAVLKLSQISAASDNLGSGDFLVGVKGGTTDALFSISGGTVTASDPIFDMSQTWNNAAVTFTALRLNVTNTSAAVAANKLLDLQVGGTSQFNVSYLNDGAGTMALNFPSGINVQINAGASILLNGFGGANVFSEASQTWNLISYGLRFFTDTYMYRDAAAGVMAFSKATAGASGIRVYNTTDAINTNSAPTNYECGAFDWTTTANVLTIGTQAGGTGTLRAVKLIGSDITVMGNTATPAGGSTSARLLFGTTAGFGIYYGSGAPTVSAAAGSLYIRTDNAGASLRLYSNTTGSTTWAAVTSA